MREAILKNKKDYYSTVCYYHVAYAFQRESALYSCLNVKELLDRNRRDISSLSDSNGIQTHDRLVRKRTLNHLAKLGLIAKWLSVRLRIKWLWVQIPLLSLLFKPGCKKCHRKTVKIFFLGQNK